MRKPGSRRRKARALQSAGTVFLYVPDGYWLTRSACWAKDILHRRFRVYRLKRSA